MLESSPCKDQRVPDSIQAPCGRSDPTLKHAGTVEVGWRTNARSVEVLIRDQGPSLLNSDNLFVPFFTTKHGGSGIHCHSRHSVLPLFAYILPVCDSYPGELSSE
jgi:hypothetical protein